MANQRIAKLIEQISSIDIIVPGTISKRTKVCGRANCKCAKDPDFRHGPYYEWTRRKNGHYFHSVVSPDKAKELERGIKNHRKVQKLLDKWRVESSRVLEM